MFKQIQQTGENGGECLVRALMNVLGKSRDEVLEYAEDNGFSSNSNGFLKFSMRKNKFVEDESKVGLSIKDLSESVKSNKIVAIVDQGSNTHAISIIEGNYLDTYDSGDEKTISVYVQEV